VGQAAGWMGELAKRIGSQTEPTLDGVEVGHSKNIHGFCVTVRERRNIVALGTAARVCRVGPRRVF
jgi:hypothetical protein